MRLFRRIELVMPECITDHAHILILWSLVFIVQIILGSMVLMISTKGLDDLHVIDRSLKPSFVSSFVVGPKEFLYGKFNIDKINFTASPYDRESTIALNVMQDVVNIGVLSKICYSVNDQENIFLMGLFLHEKRNSLLIIQ